MLRIRKTPSHAGSIFTYNSDPPGTLAAPRAVQTTELNDVEPDLDRPTSEEVEEQGNNAFKYQVLISFWRGKEYIKGKIRVYELQEGIQALYDTIH